MPTTINGAQVLQRIKEYHPTAAEMAALREYLVSQGAECIESGSGTQTWVHGTYSADWARERWVGPKGHDLTFLFAGPNPVGPQKNGWSTRRGSRCPEWILADLESRRQELKERLERMRISYANLEQIRAQAKRCCGGRNPQHAATCAYRLEDGSRRLREVCRSVRSWANLDLPGDFGNSGVATAIEVVRQEMAAATIEVDEVEAFVG